MNRPHMNRLPGDRPPRKRQPVNRPSLTRLPEVTIPGDGVDAGRAYGESCRELVRRHHEILLGKLTDTDEARRYVLAVREATAAVAPELAAEVDGVGEGAGLTPAAGWMLQLRAELTARGDWVAECSSLAVTGDRGTIAAQNADLPAAYESLFVVLRRTPADGPALITVTPAGQLGHHGMNEAGVAVFANFLRTDDWGVGVPRYLLTRIALARPDRHAAAAAVTAVPRSGPRNVLIADPDGALDIETAPSAVGHLAPEAGVLLHTNHFLSDIAHLENAPEEWLRNSRTRLARLRSLVGADADVPRLAEVLADRHGAPDALSHHAADTPHLDVATVVSTVADIPARTLYTCVGAPDLGGYAPYPLDAAKENL
ncbi:C45 family autoproteolytic acyltransferase/hydrolase [Streptomyces sp. NPDC055078]